MREDDGRRRQITWGASDVLLCNSASGKQFFHVSLNLSVPNVHTANGFSLFSSVLRMAVPTSHRRSVSNSFWANRFDYGLLIMSPEMWNETRCFSKKTERKWGRKKNRKKERERESVKVWSNKKLSLHVDMRRFGKILFDGRYYFYFWPCHSSNVPAASAIQHTALNRSDDDKRHGCEGRIEFISTHFFSLAGVHREQRHIFFFDSASNLSHHFAGGKSRRWFFRYCCFVVVVATG